MEITFVHNGRLHQNFTLDNARDLGLTEEELAAALAEGRKPKVRAECRRRIYGKASAETQMNMATAAALISAKAEDDRSAEETEVLSGLNDAIGWVTDMRAAYQSISADPEADIYDDASWPPFPDGARDLVAKF
ncbi:hypothetical protein DSM110277_02500 [Sulfitobacter pontiacus]|uniref:Phage tail assembly chaperone protein n=1 Tax=Sulfitobacter pontiacus TaxID=60137 RepID=A0AAX3AD79_9RHOB|nr:hypothetical protein [Sulfitobacter pontiacus]UOA24064.1 hypothetical protein DSM110277_02500 [Sulfitobacter pontiacus]